MLLRFQRRAVASVTVTVSVSLAGGRIQDGEVSRQRAVQRQLDVAGIGCAALRVEVLQQVSGVLRNQIDGVVTDAGM